MLDKIYLWLYRGSFLFAGLLVCLALWERVLRQFQYTISIINIEPGRLVEIALPFFLITCVFLLRQIRQALNK